MFGLDHIGEDTIKLAFQQLDQNERKVYTLARLLLIDLESHLRSVLDGAEVRMVDGAVRIVLRPLAPEAPK